MISRPLRQAGSQQKLSVWVLNEDSSGKWSRTDYADRPRVPQETGPRFEDIHTRVTNDQEIGEVLESKCGFQTFTKREDLILGSRPSRVLCGFHFHSTFANMPKRAVAGEMETDRAIHGVCCLPEP